MLILALTAGWQLRNSGTIPAVIVQMPSMPAVSIEPVNPVQQASRNAVPPPAPRANVAPADTSSAELAQLNAQLTAERERLARTEQELTRQQALVAGAKQSSDEANRRSQAVLTQPQAKPDTTESQRLLAAAQLRAQQLEHDVAEYRNLLLASGQRAAAPQNSALLSDPNLRLVRLRAPGSEGVEGHVLSQAVHSWCLWLAIAGASGRACLSALADSQFRSRSGERWRVPPEFRKQGHRPILKRLANGRNHCHRGYR